MTDRTSSSFSHADDDELFARLAVEFAVLSGVDRELDPGSRSTAVRWFRSAWPTLAKAYRRRADDGADEWVVTVAQAMAPFLVEIEDWAGLVDTAARGSAAAARLGVDAEHRHLRAALAVGLQRAGRGAEAAQIFEWLAAQADAEGDHRGHGIALAHLGQLRRAEGDPVAAAGLYQRAVLEYQRAGHVVGEARSAGDLAHLLAELGNHDEAARYADRARMLFRQEADSAGEARALEQFAEIRVGAGEIDEAIRVLTEATTLFDTFGDITGVVGTLRARAQLHLQQADAGTARELAELALSTARAAGSPEVTELTEFVQVMKTFAAVDALLAADSDQERAAVVAERQELLTPPAWHLLTHRRDETNDSVTAERIGHALRLLRSHPRCFLAEMVQSGLNEWHELAGPEADRFPAELSDVLAELAVTDRPEESKPLLLSALDLLPGSGLEAVRGWLLFLLAESILPRAGDGQPEHDRAIGYAENAARLLKEASHLPQWAAVQVFLGSAWRNQDAGDPMVNVERALTAFRQALTVYRRTSHPYEWAGAMVNLANAYWRRRGDGIRDLNRAIARHTAALAVFTPEAHPHQWAMTQSNIGLVLTDPMFAGDPATAEAGRRCLLDALSVEALDLVLRASALMNLSRYYANRQVGDPEDNIESAVRLARETYDLFSRVGSRVDQAEAANVVGNAVSNAALRRGMDPGAAIEWYERALALVSEDDAPLVYAGAADNLASTLVQLEGAGSSDLLRAIELQELALRLYSQSGDRLEEARVCYNLGCTLCRGERPDFDRAITYLERSLVARTRDVVPLEWAESVTELAHTLLVHPHAADPERSAVMLREVAAATSLASASGHARRAWDLLGAAYADLGRWPEAASAYEQSLLAAEQRYRTTILPGGKDTELLHTANMPREAAYAVAVAGNPGRAVAILEASRARALGDRLERDRADLSALDHAHPELAASYRDAGGRIRTVESRQRTAGTSDEATNRILRAALTDATAQLEAVLAEIRRQLGFETFLENEPFATVAAAATPDVPLAYLALTRHGALSLLVSVPAPEAEPLIDAVHGPLTDDELLTAHTRLGPVDEERLTRILDLLGQGLVDPLADRLRELDTSHVVLVATGALGLLPVHAARYGTPRRYLVDEVAVSYAPSARALLAARAVNHACEADRPPHLVGVGEPQPCEPPLPWAGTEVAVVARMFDGSVDVLPDDSATARAVLDALPSATHLHFAGHGYYDPARPLDSHLTLAQGDRLTLRELLDGQALSGVQLVVASACQTAVTDMMRLPDESIGLPSGLLQAGAAAVIGTLWEVNDRAAALLMSRFYANHIHGDPSLRIPPMPPAHALRRAQIWLATATVEQIDEFERAVGLRRPRCGEATAARGDRAGCDGVMDRPAVGPEHWAAFVLVGDGG